MATKTSMCLHLLILVMTLQCCIPMSLARAIQCPRGFYGNTTSLSSCALCPGGMFCLGSSVIPTGICHPGYYCKEGAYSPEPRDGKTGGVCPAGRFCPMSTTYPLECPIGTFNSNEGVAMVQGCHPCPPGLYCAATGLASATGACALGFYCTGGATSPRPMNSATGGLCPAGHFCPLGCAQPHSCPAGTYNPHKGMMNITACHPCPGGLFCDNAGASGPAGRCAAGFYCSGGSMFPAQHMCPPGHYCPEGSAQPLLCPLGHYCLASSAQPFPCATGYYNPHKGGEHCMPCPRGAKCDNSTVLPSKAN